MDKDREIHDLALIYAQVKFKEYLSGNAQESARWSDSKARADKLAEAYNFALANLPEKLNL